MSTTYHIKQDGTGDFTTIQEGIYVSVDADTVLVYPGTYYENVNFLSKSIILGSLYLTTGNEDYISQTIIDGNQSGSCVEVRNCIEDYTSVIGFTLTNGIGNQAAPTTYSLVGGGILIDNSIASITKCIVKRNIAEYAGGILCEDSSVFLSGTIIKDNRAYKAGGGIIVAVSSEVYFDEYDLCSIFLNYSERGSDVYKISSPPLEVIIDTFTVDLYDNYFVFSVGNAGIPQSDITLTNQNAKLVPVDADLYVATDGDDENSGLTPNEALATINYALSLIQPDSLENNTIYLDDGIYSTTLNDQWFPLQMRSYTNLIGESMENTIFDAENLSPFITDKSSELNYLVQNLNLINGYGVVGEGTGTSWIICFSDPQYRDKWVRLENLLIHDYETNSRDIALWWISAYLKNVHFYDNIRTANTIESLSPFLNNGLPFITVEMENCTVKNCLTSGMQFGFGSNQLETSPVILKNVEITNNLHPIIAIRSCCGVIIEHNKEVNMINCTIGNNAISATQGGPINIIGTGSELNIYNSILYGNYPRNIWIGNEIEDYPNIVNIYNSLVEDGEDSCFSLYPWDEINFVENNLVGDTDPLWIDSGDYPFQLSTGSPCIDAGTLNLPAGIELPEFDLAGFPRIYGDTIDMGAYEWQGVEAEEDEITPITQTKISNYPNPFNPSTTIKLELAESGKIELMIYNIKGQKVKTLMNAYTAKGVFEAIWNGKDSNNKRVSSGEYIAKLKLNGEEVEVNKMLLLK